MLDTISIGDPTIDTILEISDATVKCQLKREDCMLCINYGEKIGVHSLYRKIAGNACNNAVGSARLGMKTAYYGVVGNDDHGEGIIKYLKKQKVVDTYFKVDKDRPTNASTVIGFNGERTILVYHAPRKYTLPKLAPSRWIYYSSVNADHKKLNRDVVAHAKKVDAKLCYNPGTFQRLAGKEAMQSVAKHCEIVFVNKREAQDLTDCRVHDIPKLLKEMLKIGMKIAVITDGENGSYVHDGKHGYAMGIVRVPVVEKTGAGDAYAATFIAMLHQGKTVPDAMCLASSNSASVILKYGPQDGLLTAAELARFHKKHAHTCARIIE